MNIQDSIANLYSTFAKYHTSDMHYCNCGCIDPEDVKKLASKKLRELEEDDFGSYHGSALYTWGEIEHYKHFLPRILEVHNLRNGNGIIGLFEITSKLEYAKWSSWDSKEINAIKNFILADWSDFANEKESEINISDLEYYSFFIDPMDLFQLWRPTSSENSIKNFVNFFYYSGSDLMNKGAKDKTYNEAINHLIGRSSLLKQLEESFFIIHESEPELAEKTSVVIQMIEQNNLPQ